MKRTSGTQSLDRARLASHDQGGPRVRTQHREKRNQHLDADVGTSGSDAASWASCTMAEMPLDHRLYPFRPPIPLWTYPPRTRQQSFVALAEGRHGGLS